MSTTHTFWSRPCAELVQHHEAVTLDVETTVREALDVLSRHRLPSAPVLDDNHCLLGVATWHDLFALITRVDGEVEDAMTPAVAAWHTVSVGALRQLMRETGAARVHVIDDEGRLVGVVTALELLEGASAAEPLAELPVPAPAVFQRG
ncbi:MAG: CBS domain-containing protein [Archangium sp.]|nr:CBS domain-containing protein [Archangium sp.]